MKDELGIAFGVKPVVARPAALVPGVLTCLAIGVVWWKGLGPAIVLLLIPIVVLARMRLAADEQGVTIVNFAAPFRLTWEEIADIRIRSRYLTEMLLFVRTDGQVIPAWVTQIGGRGGRDGSAVNRIDQQLRVLRAKAVGVYASPAIDDALAAAERGDPGPIDHLLATGQIDASVYTERLHQLAAAGRIDMNALRERRRALGYEPATPGATTPLPGRNKRESPSGETTLAAGEPTADGHLSSLGVDDSVFALNDRTNRSTLRFYEFLEYAFCLFLIVFGITIAWNAWVKLPGTYAYLHSHGVHATAIFAGCPEVGVIRPTSQCSLSLKYPTYGYTRTWVYPEDYPQFDHLLVGASVPVLVDPRHPLTVYTVHDVNSHDNSGFGVLGVFGVAMTLAGILLAVSAYRFEMKMKRSDRELEAIMQGIRQTS